MINGLTILLFLILFVLILQNKQTTALMIIVFLIPINFIPFPGNGLLLNMSAYGILFFWIISKMIGKKPEGENAMVFRLWPLYTMICMGLIFGLINSGQIQRYDTFAKATPENQMMNITVFIFIVIIFAKIFNQYAKEQDVQRKLISAFIASSFFHLISNLASVTFLRSIVPQFLISKPTITYESTFGIVIPRYGARLGSYEFVADFALIVMAFALINLAYGRAKWLSLGGIVASLIIGIMSGTRSLYVILAIFILVILYYQRRKYTTAIKYIGIVGVMAVVLSPIIYNYIQNSPLFARILDTIYRYQMYGFVGASNRNFEAGFDSLVNFGSIFGLGSYFLYTLGPSEIVSHNLLYAMFGKYGLFGVVFMLMLFYKGYSGSKRIMKISAEERIRSEAIFFIAVLFALFAQEMKYSFIRDISSILVYTFFFCTLFMFTNSTNIVENQPAHE